MAVEAVTPPAVTDAKGLMLAARLEGVSWGRLMIYSS